MSEKKDAKKTASKVTAANIGFTKENYGKIFSGDKVIADNLKEFLINYQDDESYFE